jgi:single-strand DNA-binding protein
MKGYNKATIMGNLARDVELKYTPGGQAVGNFSVAVNRAWKDKNGEKQESVDFISVVAWGATAENCEKYLKKGSPALVEGRIQTRSYEAKDGSGKRYVTEIVASEVIFLGSGKREGDQNDDAEPTRTKSAPREQGYASDTADFEPGEDSDIPF